jgi:hypothetical protein
LREETEVEGKAKIERCSVNGCNKGFHARCRDKVRLDGEIHGVDAGAQVCASHFCSKCQATFLIEESVMHCIRCYKAVHAWQPEKEGDQCFNVVDLLPVSEGKFICRDHIESDVAVLLRHDQLLGAQQLLSVHNQMKNCERPTPSDFKIQTFKAHTAEQVIPGNKRVLGFSYEDVAWRKAQENQLDDTPQNFSTEVYEQARKNLNNFLTNISSLSDMQGGNFYGQHNVSAYQS